MKLGERTTPGSSSTVGTRQPLLSRLVDVFLPPGMPAEAAQRSRLVVRLILMTLAVSLVMQFKYYIEEDRAIWYVGLVAFAVEVLALAIHRLTGSYRASAHCFCLALWLLFFGIETLSGGIDSPNLAANAFLVVVAPMLLGRREGLIWLGAALFSALAQFELTRRGLVAQTLPPGELRVTRLSEYIVTFTVVALTAYFYRRGHDLMNTELTREKQAVDAANRDLTIILDNTGQGFLSLEASGRIVGEHSAILHTWFRKPEPGEHFTTFLNSFDPQLASWFELCWEQLAEQSVPLELALEQLSKRLSVARTQLCARLSPGRAAGRFV